MSGAWCQTCRDWSVAPVGERCAWCDTIVMLRRGGWKRPDLEGRIGEHAARAIHAKYQTGVSARTLGRELYNVLGYKNPGSCERAIGAAFRRWNLPVRDRIEATVLASTSSGLSPRDAEERRRRRRAVGLVGSGERAMQPRQPRCQARKSQAPQKGRQCSRPAMLGSDYCHAHDPALEHERLAHLERMRAIAREAA